MVSSLLLRKLGSKLPVEIWHGAGKPEPDPIRHSGTCAGEAPIESVQKLLRKFGIVFKDGSEAVKAAGEMGQK